MGFVRLYRGLIAVVSGLQGLGRNKGSVKFRHPSLRLFVYKKSLSFRVSELSLYTEIPIVAVAIRDRHNMATLTM